MPALRRWVSANRLDLALAGLFLAVVAPFVPELTAQGASRYALTAAIVEQQTVELDDYRPLLSYDRVERNGHIYSDKAPGQPVLGVPVLAAAEVLGAPEATDYRTKRNIGAWSQILVFCAIPGALLLVLMRRHAARWQPAGAALLASIGLGFGTMLLPLSATLYGHVFAAFLTFGAWHLVSRSGVGNGLLLLAGTLSAIATASEYPAFYAAVVIGVWVLWRRGLARAALYASPHLIVIPLLLAYNFLAYDRAATGYTAKGGSDGRLNFIRVPDPEHVVQILFGSKGFIFTPIVLVGLFFLGLRLRRYPIALAVPAAVFGGYFLLQAGWDNPWGGHGPGPRYIAPALPFLCVPVAMGLRHLSRTAQRTIVGVGVVPMTLIVITYELIPFGGGLIATQLRHLFGDKGLNPTIFTIAFGPFGWLLHVGLVAVAVRGVIRNWPRDSMDPPAPVQVSTNR